MTPDISCRNLAQIWLQISRWWTKWRPWKNYNWLLLSHLLIKKTSIFTELCEKAAHISCRSLTQVRLQIPRWRTKWRPCKCMAVSQAFIYFAVCQLLYWAFLLQMWHLTFLSVIRVKCSHTWLLFRSVILLFDIKKAWAKESWKRPGKPSLWLWIISGFSKTDRVRVFSDRLLLRGIDSSRDPNNGMGVG